MSHHTQLEFSLPYMRFQPNYCHINVWFRKGISSNRHSVCVVDLNITKNNVIYDKCTLLHLAQE